MWLICKKLGLGYWKVSGWRPAGDLLHSRNVEYVGMVAGDMTDHFPRIPEVPLNKAPTPHFKLDINVAVE